MKKIFCVAALIALTGISVLAQEKEPQNEGPADIHLTFFNFGLEMHIPWTFEGSLDLMVLGIESRKTGFGVEFSPAHLFGWVGMWGSDYQPKTATVYDEYGPPRKEKQTDINGELGWSIINLTLFWNLMPQFMADVNYYMAPFLEFNYLVMGDKLYADHFMLSFGLSAGRRRGDGRIKYNSFSVEVGYRMIGHHLKLEGRTPNRMFIGIKFGR